MAACLIWWLQAAFCLCWTIKINNLNGWVRLRALSLGGEGRVSEKKKCVKSNGGNRFLSWSIFSFRHSTRCHRQESIKLVSCARSLGVVWMDSRCHIHVSPLCPATKGGVDAFRLFWSPFCVRQKENKKQQKNKVRLKDEGRKHRKIEKQTLNGRSGVLLREWNLASSYSGKEYWIK